MRYNISLLMMALLTLSACNTQEANSGCDKFGNCASGVQTVLNKFGEQFHQPDQSASTKTGWAPPTSNPFPQRNPMFDFQGKTNTGEIQDNIKRVAEPVTNPYAPPFYPSGPTSLSTNRIGATTGTINGERATIYETPTGTKGNIGGRPFNCYENRVGTTNCY